MAIDLTAFQAELARNTSVAASVKLALDTLKNQVDSLTTQLSQAGVDPATLSALADMQATLKANDDTTEAVLTTNGGGASTVTGGAGADTTGGGASPAPAPVQPPAAPAAADPGNVKLGGMAPSLLPSR